MTTDLTYRIVRRLLRDADVEFSRNRNFSAYDDPAVRRAARIYRHLKSVEQDLLELGQGVTLEDVTLDEDGSLELVMRLERGDSRRVSHVEREGWRLLLEGEGVREALRGARQRLEGQPAARLARLLEEATG